MFEDAATTREAMPDVQGAADHRRLAIDRVGIKDIRHPARVKDRSGGEQATIAVFNMYISLPAEFKGTHMSRFVEILNRYEREMSVRSFQDMLPRMTEQLHAESGHIEMTFPYFIDKAAPVSGVRSLLDYEVTFIGEATADRLLTDVRVVVPVTKLCPCSKQISCYGAHNQRSHVTVTVRIRQFLWIEQLIELIE